MGTTTSTARRRNRFGWVESKTESITVSETVSVAAGFVPSKPKVGLLAAAAVMADQVPVWSEADPAGWTG